MNNFDIFILAFEPSADLHGAHLIESLQKLNPQIKLGGVFGPNMRRISRSHFMEMEEFQVMGFIDVLKALPKLLIQFFKVKKEILKQDPKTVVCIDYPDFNLRLQGALRNSKFNGKIVQYICPTVWAWRKNRIFDMEKNLDLLMTIFPFEKKHFAKTGLNVAYLGHPLASKIADIPLKNKIKRVAIFPGSRHKEILMNLPIQLKALEKIGADYPDLDIFLSNHQKEPVLEISKRSSLLNRLNFFSPDENYAIMRQTDLAVAASGTITLELALHNVPTVVTYGIKPLDLFIARKLLKINLPFYSIVNIIAEKGVFFEFFGPNLTVENLSWALRRLLNCEKSYLECQKSCRRVKEMLLCESDPSDKAAVLIYNRK